MQTDEWPEMTDMNLSTLNMPGAQDVEITVRVDGTVVWINVGALCVFRACGAKRITIIDYRAQTDITTP